MSSAGNGSSNGNKNSAGNGTNTIGSKIVFNESTTTGFMNGSWRSKGVTIRMGGKGRKASRP